MSEAFNLASFDYAHRGLWTADGPLENSLQAFQAACDEGYGIELDVRPSATGTPFVFHDSLLDRMSDHSGLFALSDDAALARIKLSNGEPIPTLEDVLDIVSARVPILVELKIDGSTEPQGFARTVATLLQKYPGPIAAMSFSIDAVNALPATLMRGQLLAPSLDGQSNHDEILNLTSADFIACHHSQCIAIRADHPRLQPPLITWTVDTPHIFQSIRDHVDAVIFEGFDLAMAKLA